MATKRPRIRVNELLRRMDDYIEFFHKLDRPVPKKMSLTVDQYNAVIKKLNKTFYRGVELYPE